MKELIGAVNSQFRTEKIYEYHFDWNCVRWNGEIHIPVFERTTFSRHDGESGFSNYKILFYYILRLNCFPPERTLDDWQTFKIFLYENNPLKAPIKIVAKLEFDYYYEVFGLAITFFYRREDQRSNSSDNHINLEDKPLIETVSVKEYQKMENTMISVNEMATYLGISTNRAKTIARSVGFPKKRVGKSYKISLGALNAWVKDNHVFSQRYFPALDRYDSSGAREKNKRNKYS